MDGGIWTFWTVSWRLLVAFGLLLANICHFSVWPFFGQFLPNLGHSLAHLLLSHFLVIS